MEDHFVAGMKLTSLWPNHRSARIRRAACQSLMQRKAKTTDDRLPPILKRLAVLMKDDDIYVRKCCGPYVVAYLAYTYPRIVIPWLKDQAHSANLNVRTNVAKAFSQSLGGRRPKDGVTILKVLAKDHSRRVQQAVLLFRPEYFQKKRTWQFSRYARTFAFAFHVKKSTRLVAMSATGPSETSPDVRHRSAIGS